jgi:hypothetical protein
MVRAGAGLDERRAVPRDERRGDAQPGNCGGAAALRRVWLCRSRALGGMEMPRDVAATRALSIRLIVDGLALRAAREPGLDLDELRQALNVQLERLLS